MRMLLVDDEPRRMDPYVEELRQLGEVTVVKSVDDALKLLRAGAELFDVVIIDVSMPPGEEFLFEDTDGGARTGKALYDTIRREKPHMKVVVFTHVSDPSVARHFASTDSRLCRFMRKPEVLPFQFAEEVETFVRCAREENDR